MSTYQNFETDLVNDCTLFRACHDKFEVALKKYKAKRSEFEAKEIEFLRKERLHFETRMTYISKQKYLDLVEALSEKKGRGRPEFASEAYKGVEEIITTQDKENERFQICKTEFLAFEKNFLEDREKFEKQKTDLIRKIKKYHTVRKRDLEFKHLYKRRRSN